MGAPARRRWTPGRSAGGRSFWRGRAVFVTGCSGFLGSWLAAALQARGARVVGLVRDHVPDSPLWGPATARVVIVRGALEDRDLLERILNEYEIDTVFHLAAQTLVGVANRNPVSTFKSNIEGTWNVLEACRRAGGVSRVVVASSDKAYGEATRLPYDEETPLRGRHPYDASKSCADLLAASYFHTYGLPVLVTRCGNLFGGGDLNFSRIIPGTIRAALAGERPVVRSDGTWLRDYFYVEDAVEAYLTAAEALVDKRLAGEAFNFSYDKPYTVLEIVRRTLAAARRADLAPVVKGEARNEIRAQWLTSRKARRVLGWRPRHTLEQGLRKTVAWYRAFFRPRRSVP